MQCFYCASDLGATSVEGSSARERLAYDPWLGRLWRVCPNCRRWSAALLDERWEVLEACERAARRDSKLLLEGEHLCLLQTSAGQLIRVGRPPRAELARWRYSDLLDSFARPRGLLARLMNLPVRPAGGNIGADYHGGVATVPLPWIASPFIEDSGILTVLFSALPLAPRCPACSHSLLIAPHDFANVRLTRDGGRVATAAKCAVCGTDVAVSLAAARPALRLGLAIVSRSQRAAANVMRAVLPVDRTGGPKDYIENLAGRDRTLGMLSPRQRLSLWISLDECSEIDVLEAEWRRAEELAAIMDDELTDVPGFREFLRRVTGPGTTFEI
jgi:hypothetical protein